MQSYRYGNKQNFAFGDSATYYQIRILSKVPEASVEIYAGATDMNPSVTDSSPIFQISNGQEIRAHDLPPLVVLGRLNENPIIIRTKSPQNLPIDDVLRFEVSKLPDVMDIDDTQKCFFPNLTVSGPRVISSKFFPSREIFKKDSKEQFQIKNVQLFRIFKHY